MAPPAALACLLSFHAICAVSYRTALKLRTNFSLGDERALKPPCSAELGGTRRNLRNFMSASQQEFLKVCTVCGEIFDANIEAEGIHHRQLAHAPLRPAQKPRRRPALTVMCAQAR